MAAVAHEFPAWNAVYYYHRWLRDGTWASPSPPCVRGCNQKGGRHKRRPGGLEIGQPSVNARRCRGRGLTPGRRSTGASATS